MKLAVAAALFCAYTAILVFGLVKAVAGHPLWLLAALVLFFLGFVRFGCKAH